LEQWQNKKRTIDEEEKNKKKTANQTLHSHNYKPKVIQPSRKENNTKSCDSDECNDVNATYYYDNMFESPHTYGPSGVSNEEVFVDKHQKHNGFIDNADADQVIEKSLPDIIEQENDKYTSLDDDGMIAPINIETEKTTSATIEQQNEPVSDIIHDTESFNNIMDVEQEQCVFDQNTIEISENEEDASESVDVHPTSVDRPEQVDSIDQNVCTDGISQDHQSLYISEPEKEDNHKLSEVSQEEQNTASHNSIIDLSFSFRFFTQRQIPHGETSTLEPFMISALSVINNALISYNGNVSLHLNPFCSDIKLDSSHTSSNPSHANKYCYLVYVSMSFEILPHIDISQLKEVILNNLRLSVTNGVFKNGSREL